jgi:hypothetical protein
LFGLDTFRHTNSDSRSAAELRDGPRASHPSTNHNLKKSKKLHHFLFAFPKLPVILSLRSSIPAAA